MAMQGEGRRVTRLTDPTAIRALAHDVRQRLVSMLARGREFTATEAAAEIGISPSAMSYHLRLLAKYGLAEPADPSGDGREKRWRGTFDSLVMDPEGDVDRRSAAAHLEIFQAALRQSVLVSLALPDVPTPEGRSPRGSGISMARVEARLTPADTAELSERLSALLTEFNDRSAADDPAAAPVQVFSLVAPQAVPGAPDLNAGTSAPR